MRNNKKTLSMFLLAISTLSMTGCAKEMKVDAYGINTGWKNQYYGDSVFMTRSVVKSGKFVSASLEETYTPNVWARISSDDLSKVGEDDYLTVKDVKLETGDTGNLYFAKYIEINGTIWTGNIRDEDDRYYSHYEYVQYSASDNTESADNDLLRYLSVKDASTYKLGDNVKTYYNAVIDGNIKIMKKTSEDKYDDSTIAPYFPNGKKLKSENIEVWKNSAKALCDYFVGKGLNYKEKIEDPAFDTHYTLKLDDGTWFYNPELCNINNEKQKQVNEAEKNGWEEIKGCTKDGINSIEMDLYFYTFNQAFASVEYDSLS